VVDVVPSGERSSRASPPGHHRAGDTVTPRLRPPSDEKTQSRLAQGHHWAGNTVTTRLRAGDVVTTTPRPTPGGRRSRLARGNLAVIARSRVASSGRRSHASPHAILGQENAVTPRPRPPSGARTHSWLTQGRPWAGDTVTARPSPSPGGRQSRLTRNHPRA
jgi:hypothetical protein